MSQFSIRPLIKRFAVVYILGSIGVALLMFLIEKFLGFSGNLGTSFVALFVAGMDMGQGFYKQLGRIPEKSESWLLARWATGVVAVFSVISVILMLVFSPAIFFAIGLPGFLIVFVILLFMSLLVLRFFIRFGAKNLAKVEARTKS